jgi:N-glycosylase/DNA lyase
MIIQSQNFNIKHIADSGQCFRMNQIAENKFNLIAYDRYIELTQLEPKTIEINCTEEDYETIWKEYFDISYPYDNVVMNLINGEDIFLKEAAAFGNGLRILQQDIFEILISFIISQRKNIPAIKSCIEQLSVKYGDKKVYKDQTYYTFPTPERLASAKLSDLRETGLGYRDEYILKTSQAVLDNDIDLLKLKTCGYEEAINQLKSLPGVGIKVANCVALYGLHYIDAFPIDVWIQRILNDVYKNTFEIEKYSGYAGIVQQYMFYYIRNK